MPFPFIFHTVNSGLYFHNGRTGILVDALHQGQEIGYSPMPELLRQQMLSHTVFFQNSNHVLFTHLHKDHFDETFFCEFLNVNPHCAVYAPSLSKSNALIRQVQVGVYEFWIDDFQIFAFDTVHDGENFRLEPHQSFLINSNGFRFFIAGDAILDSTIAARLVEYAPINTAFVNPYQLINEESLGVLRGLQTKHICLYHLPFPEDDRYHYRKLARQITKKQFSGLPEIMTLQPMTNVSVLL